MKETITRGTAVGKCDNCGFLRDEDFEFSFPNEARCPVCKDEIQVAVLDESIEVDPEVFAL